MKGLYFVEPVVALYSFACFLIYPLVSQYVYRRMWQDLTNTTYPATENASSCMVNTNQSSHEVSKFIKMTWTYVASFICI